MAILKKEWEEIILKTNIKGNCNLGRRVIKRGEI
jgi:hypothetical protein